MKLHAIGIECGFGTTYTFYGEQLDDDVILPRWVVPCSEDPVGYLGAKSRPRSGYQRWQPLDAPNTLTLDASGQVCVHSDDGIYFAHFPLAYNEQEARVAMQEDYAYMLIAYHDNVKSMIDTGTHIVGMRKPVLPKEIVFSGDLIDTIFSVPTVSLNDLKELLE